MCARCARRVSQAVCPTRHTTRLVRTCYALLRAGAPSAGLPAAPLPLVLPADMYVLCGLPPLEPSTPFFHAVTMTQRGVPRRGAVGASVRAVVAVSLFALPLPVSLAGGVPPSPDAPSVATPMSMACTRGGGAAVLQPSTTARARSPIVMCCSSCSSSAPHQLLIS